MSMGAITMMVVSMVLLWGGLVAAVVHLRRHPEAPEDD
ncbi:methionine/alanine import family NSS transporter small subunit [Nocardiopsis flavescens]|uniref:Putative methionine and alanine importer, small subunit n=1 Tax=Nocardiopsis flavescens TaxID=758803 RepID=A0A1M6AMC1_9ACTN|nr:methionine/alanine import family NSS transporter small subunit [Nocardiopsis flavescens]SHI37650.1 Putative methionine and alanine importer, small subunit [Nocardiopsis flavescens]